MTTTTAPPLRTADRASGIARGGTLLVAAGATGALAGVALAVWPREVSADLFSHPLGTTSHVVFQLFFTVHHLGLVAGVLALGWLAGGWAGRGVRIGLGLAVLGLAGLTVMEAVTAFAGLGITVGSERGQLLGALYGLVSLTTGVGLVLAGAGLARRPVLPGRGRWLPLALGAWVFVPMMPALFAPMVWGRLAIIGWMLLFADLGLHLRRAAVTGAVR